jgi:hypothetical protein
MKFLTACARLVAGFFAILFIITACISVLLFNAQLKFTNPELYKRVMIEERVYDSLPRLLSLQISKGLTYDPCAEDPTACESEGEESPEEESGGPPDYFKNLDKDQWESLLREILTPEWLQAQAESLIDQSLDFLESDQATPSIKISLVELKSKLMGPNGVEIVLSMIKAQPACTEAQLREIKDAIGNEDGEQDLLSCLPTPDVLDEYASSIEGTLNEVVGELPDEAVLGESFMEDDANVNTDSDENEVQVGPTLRRIRTYMRISPLVPLTFLILIAVFAVRSFRDLLRWWGIPLLITGLIVLIFSLLSVPLFDWSLRTYVEERIPGYFSSEFVGLGLEIGRAIMRSYVKTITIQSAVLVTVGVMAIICSAFIQPRRQNALE